jgi:hypothetical protein
MTTSNFAIRFFMGIFLMLALGTSQAQPDNNPANCNEVKDPDVQFQMELCTAHPGCKLVMSIHKTCVKAKKFLNNLKEQIGEGVKGLFGYRKEVTSDNVFEASMTDEQRAVTQDKDWRKLAETIKESQKNTSKEVLTGRSSDGGTWTYIGETSNGLKNGRGTTFYSNGQIDRGEFLNDARNGSVDAIVPNGTRLTGTFQNDQLNGMGYHLGTNGLTKYKGYFVDGLRTGQGVLELADGTRYEGQFKGGAISGQGIIYYNDGSIWQRGVFESNKLSVGKIYSSAGVVLAEVNQPLDEQKKRESAQLAAIEKNRAEEAERLAQQQRQREAQAAAEKAYRDSLAQMNAGQLFARADELSSAGEPIKAREVLRTLLSRFPDHALAATAAAQLSKMAGSAGSGSEGRADSGNASAQVPVRASGMTGRPFEDCVNSDKANTALTAKLNAIPPDDAITFMRGAHFASRWMLENYSQCLPDPRAKAQVDQYRKTMTDTLQSCRQLSTNRSICEVSPL